MEDTSGFYKAEDGVLLYAPNFVSGPSFELVRELHTTYSYPVEGWMWFNNEETAIAELLPKA